MEKELKITKDEQTLELSVGQELLFIKVSGKEMPGSILLNGEDCLTIHALITEFLLNTNTAVSLNHI